MRRSRRRKRERAVAGGRGGEGRRRLRWGRSRRRKFPPAEIGKYASLRSPPAKGCLLPCRYPDLVSSTSSPVSAAQSAVVIAFEEQRSSHIFSRVGVLILSRARGRSPRRPVRPGRPVPGPQSRAHAHADADADADAGARAHSHTHTVGGDSKAANRADSSPGCPGRTDRRRRVAKPPHARRDEGRPPEAARARRR